MHDKKNLSGAMVEACGRENIFPVPPKEAKNRAYDRQTSKSNMSHPTPRAQQIHAHMEQSALFEVPSLLIGYSRHYLLISRDDLLSREECIYSVSSKTVAFGLLIEYKGTRVLLISNKWTIENKAFRRDGLFVFTSPTRLAEKRD